MKKALLVIASALLAAGSITAQKGIDTQTQTIKDDGDHVTTRPNDATRSIDWGKGKTRVRPRLANPYRLSARRDALLESIENVLKDQKMVIDESASRLKDGIIVTQPFIFARGAVTTESQLSQYGVIENSDTAWTRAQYSLTIEVQSIDGVKNNVSVNAKVEGREGNGLTTEWMTLQSTGQAEDEFLAKLVEAVTGTSVEPQQDVAPPDH